MSEQRQPALEVWYQESSRYAGPTHAVQEGYTLCQVAVRPWPGGDWMRAFGVVECRRCRATRAYKQAMGKQP